MANELAMSAQARDGVGKGAARALRRAGRAPAVIYGANKDPRSISVDPSELMSELNKSGFYAQLIDMDVDGDVERVVCRDVQLDPLKDQPIHADFLRVTPTTRLNIEVPVNFINEEESPGLKLGGVLNVVRRTVELSALASAIPQEIVIDLTGRDIGDSIHISEVTLPEGVHAAIIDRDFTVATIAAPTVIAADDEAGEGVEGEEGAEAAAEGTETSEESAGGESDGGSDDS